MPPPVGILLPKEQSSGWFIEPFRASYVKSAFEVLRKLFYVPANNTQFMVHKSIPEAIFIFHAQWIFFSTKFADSEHVKSSQTLWKCRSTHLHPCRIFTWSETSDSINVDNVVCQTFPTSLPLQLLLSRNPSRYLQIKVSKVCLSLYSNKLNY